jgi:nitroimidazol reductase NimA-like FMN-containing flavoprotein (pyridoxamine 5'-phosphate oxidase superfamily)
LTTPQSPDTPDTEVRRQPERGSADRATIDAILDEAMVCHVGFIDDSGYPVVIPMLHARDGDHLLVHGSPASRLVRRLRSGVPVSVAVTILDGLVLARSVFNHSANYRSVVLFGTARPIDDPEEKLAALRVFTERLTPGRWEDARRPTGTELRATAVLAVPIEAATAKVRAGPPEDEDDDYDLGVWAGVIPYRMAAGDPVADPRLRPGIPVPPYLLPVSPRDGG